jgi:hypothetical protein
MALNDFAAAITAVNTIAEELLPDVEAELASAYTAANTQAAGVLTADATWHKPDADEVYDNDELRRRIEASLAHAKGELDASIAHRLGAPPGDYDVSGIAAAVAGRHREAVQAALLDGWNEGKSVDQMAEILAGIGQSSPSLVARTSMNGMSNATSLSGAHYAEVELKEWLSAEDDRVRDTHVELDGEQQPLTGTFTNGCRFPGDLNGPPEEVWNCRCTLIYPDPPDRPDGRTADGGLMPDTVEPMHTLTSAAAIRAAGTPPVLATWSSPGLAYLNTPTGDGRALTGDITWATLPLPLMAQLEDAHGSMPTMRSQMAGGIDHIALDGNAFPASGVLDDTEDGRAALSALETGRYGVSIDLAVEEWEMALDAEAWGWLFGIEQEEAEDPPPANEGPSMAKDAGLVPEDAIVFKETSEDELLVITKGRIRGATIVPFAAFEKARIVITASGEQGAPEMIRYTAPITLVITRAPAGVSTDVLAAVAALEDAVEADKLPALATAVSSGILTPDEARAALGRPPLADPQPASQAPLSTDTAQLLSELRSSAAEREAALETLTQKVGSMAAAPAKITFHRDEQGRITGAERS